MNKILIILAVIFSLLLFPKNIEAKVLPQAAKNTQKQISGGKNPSGTGIRVSPRLRADRRALVVNFANLQNASNVSYALTYNTGEQQEGALGTLNLGGASNSSSELLFGTCSKNVCRYHTNISNARLEVSYTSKSGNKYIKRYKIRV